MKNPGKIKKVFLEEYIGVGVRCKCFSFQADTLACGGIDQLTEKLPQLKDATPKLINETKVIYNIYSTYIRIILLPNFRLLSPAS